MELIHLFDEFIKRYSKIEEQNKDDDTTYYSKMGKDELEIYYHFKLNDAAEEFSYNYTEEDKFKISKYLGDKELYILDISFRDVEFKDAMLHDFEAFLKSRNTNLDNIIISDSFKDIFTFPIIKT